MQLFAQSAPAVTSMLGLILTVGIAAWYDWTAWRIPNRLLSAAAAAGLMLALFTPGGIGLSDSLGGALTGLALFLPFYLLRGMAAGDVKLLATTGFFAGPALTLDIALLSFLIGGVWAVAILITQSSVGLQMMALIRSVPGAGRMIGRTALHRQSAPALHGQPRAVMPYGVVIALGTFAAITIAHG